MFYLWGYYKQSDGKYTPVISLKNPFDQKYLEFEDWKFTNKDFDNVEEALYYGKKLIDRYNKMSVLYG